MIPMKQCTNIIITKAQTIPCLSQNRHALVIFTIRAQEVPVEDHPILQRQYPPALVIVNKVRT